MKHVGPTTTVYSPFNGAIEETTGPDFQPGDNGLIGWPYDPVGPALVGGTALTTSSVYMIKVKAIQTTTVNNLQCFVSSAGATFTSSDMALYDNSGNRLGITASQNTAWATTGLKTAALTSGAAVTAGQYYHIALRATATTRPVFAAIVPTIYDVANANLGAADARFAQASGTNTTMPATVTMSSRSVTTNQYIWCCMKG